MGATNKTINYQLPIFTDNDIPSWLEDFNGAMNSIDTNLKKVSDAGGDVNQIKEDLKNLTTKVTSLETTVNTLKSKVINIVVVDDATGKGLTATQYNKLSVKQ